MSNAMALGSCWLLAPQAGSHFFPRGAEGCLPQGASATSTSFPLGFAVRRQPSKQPGLGHLAHPATQMLMIIALSAHPKEGSSHRPGARKCRAILEEMPERAFPDIF